MPGAAVEGVASGAMDEDDSTSGEEVAIDSPAGLPSDDDESVDGDSDSFGTEEESTSGTDVVPATCSLVSAPGATEDSSPGEEVGSTISG